MIRFNSALLANAAEFTGKYAPYQGIELAPAPGGGIYVTSTDKGNIAFFGYDAAGEADQCVVVFPTADLIKLCRGIKTADRELRISDGLGKVTTFRKSSNEVKETPVQFSSIAFPELGPVVQTIVGYWNNQPPMTTTCGSYDSGYVAKALKCLGGQRILSALAHSTADPCGSNCPVSSRLFWLCRKRRSPSLPCLNGSALRNFTENERAYDE